MISSFITITQIYLGMLSPYMILSNHKSVRKGNAKTHFTVKKVLHKMLETYACSVPYPCSCDAPIDITTILTART
jgi:hypothetical protein